MISFENVSEAHTDKQSSLHLNGIGFGENAFGYAIFKRIFNEFSRNRRSFSFLRLLKQLNEIYSWKLTRLFELFCRLLYYRHLSAYSEADNSVCLHLVTSVGEYDGYCKNILHQMQNDNEELVIFFRILYLRIYNATNLIRTHK